MGQTGIKPKRIVWIIILVIILGFLFFWVGSLAKVWALTAKHGHEFTHEYLQTGMIDYYGFPERVRVMLYSEDAAIVYYSKRNGSRHDLPRTGLGVLITFTKTEGEWLLDKWDAIWSGSGSADGFIWPFVR